MNHLFKAPIIHWRHSFMIKLLFTLILLGSYVQGTMSAGPATIIAYAIYVPEPGLKPRLLGLQRINKQEGFWIPVVLQDGSNYRMHEDLLKQLILFKDFEPLQVFNAKHLTKLKEQEGILTTVINSYPESSILLNPLVEQLRDAQKRYSSGDEMYNGVWKSSSTNKPIALNTNRLVLKTGNQISVLEANGIRGDKISIKSTDGLSTLLLDDIAVELCSPDVQQSIKVSTDEYLKNLTSVKNYLIWLKGAIPVFDISPDLMARQKLELGEIMVFQLLFPASTEVGKALKIKPGEGVYHVAMCMKLENVSMPEGKLQGPLVGGVYEEGYLITDTEAKAPLMSTVLAIRRQREPILYDTKGVPFLVARKIPDIEYNMQKSIYDYYVSYFDEKQKLKTLSEDLQAEVNKSTKSAYIQEQLAALPKVEDAMQAEDLAKQFIQLSERKDSASGSASQGNAADQLIAKLNQIIQSYLNSKTASDEEKILFNCTLRLINTSYLGITWNDMRSPYSYAIVPLKHLVASSNSPTYTLNSQPAMGMPPFQSLCIYSIAKPSSLFAIRRVGDKKIESLEKIEVSAYFPYPYELAQGINSLARLQFKKQDMTSK